jgi:hypothetical protein
MGVTITASGRVYADRRIDQARLLADLVPPEVLATMVRFILDGGRGSVVWSVRDRGIIGARIDAILM